MTRKLGLLLACSLVPVALAGCDPKEGGSDSGAETGDTDGQTTGGTDGEDDDNGSAEGGSASTTVATTTGSTTVPGTSSTGPDDTSTTDDSESDSETATSTSTTGEVVPECEEPEIADLVGALAIRYGDIPEPDPGDTTTDTGGSSGTAGGGPDPDAIVIELSNQPNSCDDPSPLLSCGDNWNVTIVIPPELQEPGTYGLLEDLNGGYFWMGELHPDPFDEFDCPGGGGSLGGTLTIFSIDENGVDGILCGTDAIDFDADGEFSAPLCP